MQLLHRPDGRQSRSYELVGIMRLEHLTYFVPVRNAGQFNVSRLMHAGKVLDQVILLFMKGPQF